MVGSSSRQLIQFSTAVPPFRSAKGFSNGTQPGSSSCSWALQLRSAQPSGDSTPTTKVASAASPTSAERTNDTIHVTPTASGCLNTTMQSQQKNPKALPKSSILRPCGRVTRSQATLSTGNAVSRLSLQAPSSHSSQQTRKASTATSCSENSTTSNVASLSSRASTLEYVDESGTASSDDKDADMQVESSSEYSETSSDAYPKPPAAKRTKVLQLPKQKVVPEEPKPGMVPEEPKRPAPPNMQIKTKDAWNFKSGIEEKLPPISNIVEIFDDLTTKAMNLGLGKATQHLGSRKLKLATMCSGTESPLLALQLVSESLKKYHGIKFEVEHLFSAEIVPFKQAYIERNFHPSIIFRDIRELIGNDKASTAYGAEVQIPSDVDILVAGFSCVDFSRLNSARKALSKKGESGDTFRAVLNYAMEKRPALIVLENVLNAPWDEIAEYWNEAAGYTAMYVKVDTKQYYIPHTRQRGYMLCIDKQRLERSSASVAKWGKLMESFQRPASSPVEAFLLSEDDTRVHLAREEMIKGATGEEKSGRDVDWTLCQGRHQNYRAEHHLGTKRPLTGWQQGGSSSFPDYAWIDWNKAQTDRVKDTCDLSYLRSAKRGYDLEFKTRSIELSQNIDRYLDTTPPGITSCITPTGQPYITTRGRPLIGLESLALQGLPIDSLLLTRETTNQLQDLAGNAMTSTVVGAAILSALIVGHPALKGAKVREVSTQQQISKSSGDDSKLKELPLELTTYERTSIATLVRDAERSARLCYCEGQNSLTWRRLQRCTECSHTTCRKCGGIPTHVYQDLDPNTVNLRISPQGFQEQVKKLLPMRLTLSGLGVQDLDEIRTRAATTVREGTWKQYMKAIIPALGEELRFHSLRRNQSWTIHYHGPDSRLELLLQTHGVEWRLFAQVPKQEPVDSTLRKLLQHPFARMTPGASDLFNGRWQFRVPSTTRIPLMIEGKGRLTRSWESRIGLQDLEFADKQVWTELRIQVDQPSATSLELDVSGDYKWLPDCGTASCSLHKRVSGHDSLPVFLFLDPERTGDSSKDQFVFSTDINRLTYGEVRSTIARLESSWRPSARIGPQHVNCSTFGEWINCRSVALRPFASSKATFAVPTDNFQIAIAKGTPGIASSPMSVYNNCAAAVNTVLHCKVSLNSGKEVGWKKGDWVAVDQTNERALFASFAWLTEKARDLNGFPTKWRPLHLPAKFHQCQECAPNRPAIAWRLDEQTKPPKIVPYEDPREAGFYERAIKARPGPFVTRVRINDNNMGLLTIGLNVCTLVHRAVANLCGGTASDGVEVSWHLDTKFIWQPQISLPQFTFPNNKKDAQSAQPPHWKGYLRSEQLRSLSWMVSREAADVEPFIEQEIEEAILPQMGWRAEGRARRPRQIRGGVLADHVGYGKTAITLGLIDMQFGANTRVLPAPGNGKIPIKATLIVVPTQLIPQWKREVKKFLGETYTVLAIQTQQKFGNCTIHDFIAADIVIAAWSMFDNDTYLEKLAAFAALPEAPSSGGRAFQAWYQRALNRMSKHLDTLIAHGASSLRGMLETELAAAEEDEELLKFVPSKRLRGTAYTLAQQRELEGTDPSTGKGRKRKAEALDVDEPELFYAKDEPEDDGQTDERVDLKAKPKAKDQDFFSLKSSAAKAHWVKVRCPLFQLFEFNRLVVDEYTYLDDKDFTLVTTLQANYRWVLSGTPPTDDFADIKVMAGFLQIALGIDDDAAGIMKGRNIKAIRKDRTTVEQFQSFRQVHSPDWHLNRHKVAQLFLDQFARRNKPEIGEIPCQEDLVPIKLPAAERASYMELNQQLMSQDMKISRGGGAKIDSDRAKRLREIMGSSKSPEEALLKRCSHFTLEDLGENRENASQDCDLIVQTRMSQYKATVAELKENLKHAIWLKGECTTEHEHFTKWRRSVSTNAFGDLETRDVLMEIIERAEKEYSKEHEDIFYRQPPTPEELQAMENKKEAEEDGKEEAKKKAKKAGKVGKAKKAPKTPKGSSKKKSGNQPAAEADSDAASEESVSEVDTKDTRPIRLDTEKEKVQALRTLTGHLRNLAKELISRTRALRFFKVVRAVQLWQSKPLNRSSHKKLIRPADRVVSQAPTCSRCKSVARDPSTIAILGLCGHTACVSCIAAPERGGECVMVGCDVPAHSYHIHKATEVGQEDQEARVGRHDGKKMEDVMDLIKNKIPEQDQVLIFVQFNDLMGKVSAALDYHGIKHWALMENSRTLAYKRMEDFQINNGEDQKKVLVLNLADESAAGANLTNANHVIFLSPLLADSRQHYESAMEQAIGRVLRYGQLKPVRIYRYLALKTIDVDIIQGRAQKKLALVGGKWGLYQERAISESEKQDWGGGTVLNAQYLSDED